MKKLLLYSSLLVLHSSLAFSQGIWSPRASLPDSIRGYGIGFSIGNVGYAGLGANAYGAKAFYFHDFWQFDPTTNTWLRKADFPGRARICPVTFVIGHKAFVITGRDSLGYYLTENWEYDANANKWTRKADFLGEHRAYAVGFAIGSKGFVGTGLDSTTSFMNDFWEYDTAKDSWTKKTNFGGTGRYAASGFAVNDKGYVCFGEYSWFHMTNDLWQYDTGKDSWTQKSSYPGIRIYGVYGFVLGNNIYCGVGQDTTGNEHQEFWEYNTLTDTWISVAAFIGAARSACSSFAIGDTGYLGLGVDANGKNYYHDFYKFYPDSLTTINNISVFGPDIRICPNPSNGKFNIVIDNPELRSKSIIEIYNVFGVKLASLSSKGASTIQVDISDKPMGIYLYRLLNHDGVPVSSGKVIVY